MKLLSIFFSSGEMTLLSEYRLVLVLFSKGRRLSGVLDCRSRCVVLCCVEKDIAVRLLLCLVFCVA